MRPALWLAAALGCGCLGSRADEAERRAAAVEAAAERLESDEVRPRERALAALSAEVEARGLLAETAARSLKELQQALSASWGGSEQVMRERASTAAVPAALLPWLEKAQQAAGAEAPERRFEKAVAAGALDELAGSLAERVGPSRACAGPDCPDFKAPAACKRPRVALRCEPLPAAAPAQGGWVCTAPGRSEAFVAAVEDGALRTRQLKPSLGAALRVLRTQAREWWVLRREHPGPAWGSAPDTGDSVSARVWVGFWQVADDALTERLAFPADGAEPDLVDLDGDGIDEAVLVGAAAVRVAHVDVKAREVALLSPAASCALLAARPSAGPLAAHELCDALVRKAKEEAAAAAKLAAAVAAAPPPEKALEALRAALLGCDAAAARKAVTGRFLAGFEREAQAEGKPVEAFWKELCAQVQADQAVVRAATFGAAHVKGATAEVELSYQGSIDHLWLAFDEGAWKLDDPKD